MSFRLLALVPALAFVSLVACSFEPTDSDESDETEEVDEDDAALAYPTASARASASATASAKDPCDGKDAECIDKGSENKLCGTRLSKAQCDADSDCTWCPSK